MESQTNAHSSDCSPTLSTFLLGLCTFPHSGTILLSQQRPSPDSATALFLSGPILNLDVQKKESYIQKQKNSQQCQRKVFEGEKYFLSYLHIIFMKSIVLKYNFIVYFCPSILSSLTTPTYRRKRNFS